MNALKKVIPIVLLFLLFSGNEALSQIRFSEHGEEQGIKIDQRWRRSKIFDKNSDAMLVLKLKNNNDHPVKITIAVGFYNGGILAFVSEEQAICLNSGQTKKGGSSDLRFLAEEITLSDTRAEGFSWDFAKFELVEVESCD